MCSDPEDPTPSCESDPRPSPGNSGNSGNGGDPEDELGDDEDDSCTFSTCVPDCSDPSWGCVTDIGGTFEDPAVYIAGGTACWYTGACLAGLYAGYETLVTRCLINVLCRSLIGAGGGGPVAGEGVRYVWDVRTGQYRDMTNGRFVSPVNLSWPPNDGFASYKNITLNPGMVIDRYGKLSGSYAGVPGYSISARGMAPGSENMPYTLLRVVESITISGGPAAGVPAFGASGGAMQYHFSGGIQSWINSGLLEIITP